MTRRVKDTKKWVFGSNEMSLKAVVNSVKVYALSRGR